MAAVVSRRRRRLVSGVRCSGPWGACPRGLRWDSPMPFAERVLLGCSLCLTFAVLAGLATRRLYRLSYSFTVYLLAVALSEALIFLWPARFFIWSFWLTKETLYGLCKLVLALE